MNTRQKQNEFQRLLAEYDRLGRMPASGPDKEENQRKFDMAQWHLAEFVYHNRACIVIVKPVKAEKAS